MFLRHTSILLSFCVIAGGIGEARGQNRNSGVPYGITFSPIPFDGFIFDAESRSSAPTNQGVLRSAPRDERQWAGTPRRSAQDPGNTANQDRYVPFRDVADQGLRDPFVGPPARSTRRTFVANPSRDQNGGAGLEVNRREMISRNPFEHRVVQRDVEQFGMREGGSPLRSATRTSSNETATANVPASGRMARAYPFLDRRY